MRRILICGGVCALFFGPGHSAAQTAPAPDIVRGTVESSHARWSAGGTRIITESVVLRDDGSRVVVRQPGGSVDGIGMRVIPSPPPLRAGDQVEADVRSGWITDAVVYRALPRRAVDGQDSTMEFVRTTNRLGAQLYWKSGCVHIQYDSRGTSHIAGSLEFDVMDQAFAHWRQSTQSCSYFSFEFDEPEEMEVGLDGRNVVLFREDRWCRPATDDDPEECHSTSAAGLTTLFFIEDADSDRNGEILDADIELNAVNFAFSVNGESTSGISCKSDLANTFTHEVGHLLGLDHTCWDGRGTQPRDEDGNPVPNCNAPGLPAAVTEATMFAFQECGETKKGTLEQDDIDGLCAIYPVADDPDQCKRADLGGKGCCSVGGSNDMPSLGGLLMAALVALTLRRRRCAVSAPDRR